MQPVRTRPQLLRFPSRKKPLETLAEKEKNVHDHHRKKIIWGAFLASKKNFPGRWWIQKPYKNQENHIYHRNLRFSSVAPFFFFRQRKVPHWSKAVYVFFSQPWFLTTGSTWALGSGRPRETLPNKIRLGLGIAKGGVPGRGFSNSWTCCVFLRMEICYCKGILT